MSQSGFTPIQLYYSTTASTAPTAGNLANGELAINITDGRLFYKDNGGVVQVLATKGAGTVGGSNTQVQYNNAGALAGSANLTFDGTTLTMAANPVLSGGTANGIPYLNGSKVLTSGTALTYNGTGLGVGVASALSKLHISSNTASTGDFAGSIRVTNESYTAGTYAGVLFETADTLNSYITSVRQASYAGQIAFGVNTGGSGTSLSEQMRLTSTGLVVGGTAATNTSSGRGNITINGSSSAILSIGTGGTAKGYVYHSSSDMIVNATTGTLALQANGNGALIDTSGNLGLGVTPSAWGSGKQAFENQGFALWSGSTSNFLLANNVYQNSGGTYIYKNTAAASMYYQSSGSHTWYNAPSGTAGNAISFTQAMTLDASGNLLRGQTAYAGANSNSEFMGGGIVGVNHANGSASGNIYSVFYYNASAIGSITQNGTTGVLYNLTSDYRLKNNPTALNGSGEFIDALRPKTWDWWDGSGKGVGFIAHEFMEVAKYSGNGTKDAVDKDGKPVYQSIQPSSSEVMANLVAEIQSLRKRLAALESK